MSELVTIYENCRYDITEIENYVLDSNVLNSIKPGQTVVLKPNFVQEKHEYNDDWEYVITHPAVITAVLNVVTKMLQSDGKIIILDGPMTGASFSKILGHMPVDLWHQTCRINRIALEIIDLRDEQWELADNGIILNTIALPGDPAGKVVVDLHNGFSEFNNKPVPPKGFYGASYDIQETNRAHNGINNLYSVSATIISADVMINLPKMKTHKKGGITCNLKNMVGINTNKNFLPHHSVGTPSEGGDQFADSNASKILERKITSIAKEIMVSWKILRPLFVPLKKIAVRVWGDNSTTVRSGGWYGNDTLWRTILDLNKVMYYANRDGKLRDDDKKNKKNYISIVDGILAGDGNGPLAPDCVNAGLLLCGTNPVAVDCVAAKAMGFDYKRIPCLNHAFEIKHYRLIDCEYDEIQCRRFKESPVSINSFSFKNELSFKPALGWEGHIELQK